MIAFSERYEEIATRARPAILGFWACIVATAILWTIGCPRPQSGCSGGDPHAVAVFAGLIELVLIVALAWSRGRWFDAGFFVALVTGAVITGGLSTAVWRMPTALAGDSTHSIWAPLAAMSHRRSAKREWLRIHRPAQPILVHGARLVNAVEGCVEEFRAADSLGSYPRAESEVARTEACREIAPLALDADSAPDRFARADNGWRWSYLPGPVDSRGRVTRYRVRAFEDPALDRPGLTFSSDENGAVRETQPGTPAVFAASPVAALLTLQRCLTRVPAETERSSRYWMGHMSALHIAAGSCPELAGHISVDYLNQGDDGELAMGVDNRPGRGYDTVAVYTTQAIPIDVKEGLYELRARPRDDVNPSIHGGVRHFFVARDGSVHVHMAEEMTNAPATSDDPIAIECRSVGEPCSPLPAP